MNENGWTKETGGPSNNQRGYPKPVYTGGGRPTGGRPRGFISGMWTSNTGRPNMNSGQGPAIVQGPSEVMSTNYSNASGGGCSLWMCQE